MSGEVRIEDILEWPELKDVREELMDPRFGGRQHYSRATAAKGCGGPLCRKAERDRSRERNKRRGGENYQPSPHRIYDRDDLLEAIIKWHIEDLEKRRTEARAS